MASKRGLIIVAKGAEEMETVIPADVMRRADIDVTVAGLTGPEPVTCSRNVVLMPDTSLSQAKDKGPYDVIVLPGGLEGAKNLSESELVRDLLADQEKNGNFIAAICAGPTALVTHGVAKGKKLTSYPSLESSFKGYKYQQDRVVRDGNLITSRGPGTAMEFAVEIVRAVQGDDHANKLPNTLLMK